MMSTQRLVVGVVSNLKLCAGQEEFLRNYRKRPGVAVASNSALSGLSETAIVGVSAHGRGIDSVEYYSCSIGDVAVIGAFSKVTFKEGEVVSAVVEQGRGETLIAGAILRPSDSTLWMRPHCSRGLLAHRRFCIKLADWVALSVILVIAPFLWFTEPNRGAKALEHLKFYGPLLGTLSIIIGAYYSVRFYFQWRKVAKSSGEVFRMFGFHKPESIDLPRENVRTSRAQGITWPYDTAGPWIYRCPLPGANMDGPRQSDNLRLNSEIESLKDSL
jgi:hypothetical protein